MASVLKTDWVAVIFIFQLPGDELRMFLSWWIELTYVIWQLVVSLRLFITDSITHILAPPFALPLELLCRVVSVSSGVETLRMCWGPSSLICFHITSTATSYSINLSNLRHRTWQSALCPSHLYLPHLPSVRWTSEWIKYPETTATSYNTI